MGLPVLRGPVDPRGATPRLQRTGTQITKESTPTQADITTLFHTRRCVHSLSPAPVACVLLFGDGPRYTAYCHTGPPGSRHRPRTHGDERRYISNYTELKRSDATDVYSLYTAATARAPRPAQAARRRADVRYDIIYIVFRAFNVLRGPIRTDEDFFGDHLLAAPSTVGLRQTE